MPETLRTRWRNAFFARMQAHEIAQPLREAALAGRLGDWTGSLTSAVVQSCSDLGWTAAARGHLVDVLPVPRNEYLALDVMAFQPSVGSRWPLPVAAFELENSPDNERVAYALWKLLCIRVPLRILFAYRKESAEGSLLAGYLSDDVVGSLSITERTQIGGDTCVLIGSRAEGETFPYSYFKEWVLDGNIGRFIRT